MKTRTDRRIWVFGVAVLTVLLSTLVPVVIPGTITLWAIAGCLTAIAAWLIVRQRTHHTPPVVQVIRPPQATP